VVDRCEDAGRKMRTIDTERKFKSHINAISDLDTIPNYHKETVDYCLISTPSKSS